MGRSSCGKARKDGARWRQAFHSTAINPDAALSSRQRRAAVDD